jgi:hypothetical protein
MACKRNETTDLAGGDEQVVDERDDGGEARGAGAGFIDGTRLASAQVFKRVCESMQWKWRTPCDLEVLTLQGNVGEATARGVVLAGVGRPEAGNEGRDIGSLIIGDPEVV